MKPRWLPNALALAGVTAVLLVLAGGAAEGDVPATPSAAQPSGPAAAGEVRYVGNKKCKSCHTDHHASWEQSPKGRSWEALAPGKGIEVKQRSGLDPQKDYRGDTQCLGCHAVGFGAPGGYVVPAAGQERKVAALQGVGCEACHGPGSRYTEVMEEINKTKRAYTSAELYAAGLRHIRADDCRACHTASAACLKGDGSAPSGRAGFTFDDDSLARMGGHERLPLKLRQDAAAAGKRGS